MLARKNSFSGNETGMKDRGKTVERNDPLERTERGRDGVQRSIVKEDSSRRERRETVEERGTYEQR